MIKNPGMHASRVGYLHYNKWDKERQGQRLIKHYSAMMAFVFLMK